MEKRHPVTRSKQGIAQKEKLSISPFYADIMLFCLL
jgi:hypothetical protein